MPQWVTNGRYWGNSYAPWLFWYLLEPHLWMNFCLLRLPLVNTILWLGHNCRFLPEKSIKPRWQTLIYVGLCQWNELLFFGHQFYDRWSHGYILADFNLSAVAIFVISGFRFYLYIMLENLPWGPFTKRQHPNFKNQQTWKDWEYSYFWNSHFGILPGARLFVN